MAITEPGPGTLPAPAQTDDESPERPAAAADRADGKLDALADGELDALADGGLVESELLIEDVSIDGMCGVY